MGRLSTTAEDPLASINGRKVHRLGQFHAVRRFIAGLRQSCLRLGDSSLQRRPHSTALIEIKLNMARFNVYHPFLDKLAHPRT